MKLTTIYRIPRSKLKSIEPDTDYLERFPCFDFEGVDSGYWPILASKLNLGLHTEPGDPLFFDEAGGAALFEWSPEFVQRFCQTDQASLATAIDDLDKANAYPGHDIDLVREGVEKLRRFLHETDCKLNALVEFATF